MSVKKSSTRWLTWAGSVLLFLILVQVGTWVLFPRLYPPQPTLESLQRLLPAQKCSSLKPAPNNQFRNFSTGSAQLLILGDSVSLAHEKNSWPKETVKRLQEILDLDHPLRTEILARPGWDSQNRLEAWRAFKEQQTRSEGNSHNPSWPNLVIWQITLNDLLDEVTVTLNGQQTRITGVCRDKPSLCKKALFGEPVTGILSWWRHQQAQRLNTVSLNQALKNSQGILNTKKVLQEFSKELSQTPSQGMVLIIPYLFSNPSPFEPITLKAEFLAENAGLPVLNLGSLLGEYPLTHLRCRLSDFVHPSLKVQQIIAAELAGELSKRNWDEQH